MWPAESWLTRWDGAHPFPFVVCAEGWEVLCFSELPRHRPLVQQRCRMNEQETHLHSPAATRRELWKNQDFFFVLYIILAEAPPQTGDFPSLEEALSWFLSLLIPVCGEKTTGGMGWWCWSAWEGLSHVSSCGRQRQPPEGQPGLWYHQHSGQPPAVLQINR